MNCRCKLFSVTRSLCAVGLSSAVIPLPVVAQTTEGEKVQEEVIVTGTRIKRSSYDGGGQILNIDRVQIDAIGALTAADILRGSPLNSYGSFSERSGSSAQSNATIDLRGLGDERTLVMIDGRRMVGSPNLGASVINVNMIPMAAVERVDILADGASAVYGSDAVAGVVNMQMRKGFDGLEFNVRYGDRSEDDGTEYGASFIAGASNDRGNITVAIEMDQRDPIWDRDREYTAPWARDNNGNGVIDAYGDTDGYSIYGKSISLYDETTGFDQILAATSCQPGDGFLGVVDADIDWGYPSDLDQNTYCMYGYADVSANKAELRRLNTYIDTRYTINDFVELYSTAIISKVDSFGRFAPPAATWDHMPADYSDVPFDIDALLEDGSISENYDITGFYRWTNVGNRDNEVSDNQTDITFGLRGDFTDNISYDTYLQHSKYTSKEFGYYYLSYLGLNYVLSEGIDPFSSEGAFAMSATATQDNFSEMTKSYGHIQMDLGDPFGAGEIMALTGMEYTALDYQNRYDRASEGGFVGGSAGNSSEGSREIFSAFGEVVAPITNALELSAALRYDSYTDFGEQVSSTLSATWEINGQLTWRARMGEGFRAPGLDQLYGPDTFSAESASDQYTCSLNNIAPQDCSSSQFDTYFSTNAELDAETSTSLSTGIAAQLTDNIAIDIGYWDIEIEDVITQPLPQSLFYAEAGGVAFDPSSGTYIDRQGGRAVIYSGYVNQGDVNARGIDYQVSGLVDSDAGTFTASLFITQMLSYKAAAYFGGPSQEKNGFNLMPKYRAQAMLGWSLRGHTIDFVLDVVGSSSNQDFVEYDSSGKAYLATSSERLGSWRTMNLSYSYDTEQIGEIKLGGRNITNEEPILDRNGKFDVTHYDLYDNTGRVIYIEYKLKI